MGERERQEDSGDTGKAQSEPACARPLPWLQSADRNRNEHQIVDPEHDLERSQRQQRHPQFRAEQKFHRSEEHTSELQSLMRISYAVFCLKKKNSKIELTTIINYYNIIQTRIINILITINT